MEPAGCEDQAELYQVDVALALTPTPCSPTDPFVKVYLLQDGRKMSKKKTAVKRDDPNPVFNEAMIFSVPAIVLQVRGDGSGVEARPGGSWALGPLQAFGLAS